MYFTKATADVLLLRGFRETLQEFEKQALDTGVLSQTHWNAYSLKNSAKNRPQK